MSLEFMAVQFLIAGYSAPCGLRGSK